MKYFTILSLSICLGTSLFAGDKLGEPAKFTHRQVAEFKQLLQDKKQDRVKVVFVYFGYTDCGPCRAASPQVDRMAESGKYRGKIAIVKVNADDTPDPKPDDTSVISTLLDSKQRPLFDYEGFPNAFLLTLNDSGEWESTKFDRLFDQENMSISFDRALRK